MKTKFIYTQKPSVSYFCRCANRFVVIEFNNCAEAHKKYVSMLDRGYEKLHKYDGKGYHIIDPDYLLQQSERLISRLEDELSKYYREDMRLGRIAIAGSGLIRMKLKRIIAKAKRRKNRRIIKAGKHTKIVGLEGLINSLDSSFF